MQDDEQKDPNELDPKLVGKKRAGGVFVSIGVTIDESLWKFQAARRHLRRIRTIFSRVRQFDGEKILKLTPDVVEDLNEADRHLEDIAGAQGMGDDLDLPEEMETSES